MASGAPKPPAARNLQLDTLRGFAVLGMVVVSVGLFARPFGALDDPTFAAGGLEPANLWTWGLGELLVEGKAIAIFALLFGAGVVMLGERGFAQQLLRLVFLFGIGAAHAYGLWSGDLLMVYAACGVVALLLRRLPVGVLLTLGTVLVVSALHEELVPELRRAFSAQETVAPVWFQERDAALEELYAPDVERAAHEGTWLEQARWRAEVVWWRVFRSTFELLRCGGLMLIGMALAKTGFLAGAARRRSYLAVAGVGLVLGAALTGLGLWPELQEVVGQGELTSQARTIAFAAGHVGAAVMALGLVGALLFACSNAIVRRLARPLAAVGRMSLSNYLVQSLVCVLVYQGWAFGRWGTHDVADQLLVVGALWAGYLLFCPLWMMHFRLGPVEWFWRSLTCLKLQPLAVEEAVDHE